jgi:hypothetical protein
VIILSLLPSSGLESSTTFHCRKQSSGCAVHDDSSDQLGSETPPRIVKLASFSIVKYGANGQRQAVFPDAGNGVRAQTENLSPATILTTREPTCGLGISTSWMQHLTSTWDGR